MNLHPAFGARKPGSMVLPVVLIVDDDPLQLALYEAMLRRLSCTIMTASGGNQALELLYEIHPVVILLDVVMADLDGLQVLHRLRADQQFSLVNVKIGRA